MRLIFSHCLMFFHVFLELVGHFFWDFGVLGSSLDVFGAGGVQGGDLVEMIRSIGPLLAPFWSHFWSKMVMCFRCLFRCVVGWYFYGCWVVLGVLLRGFWTTFSFFLESVNMWKLAPRLHESSIFKVGRGLVLYSFEIFGGLVSGWLQEWILSDLGMDLGSLLASEIDKNGIDFGSHFWTAEKRTTPISTRAPRLQGARLSILL